MQFLQTTLSKLKVYFLDLLHPLVILRLIGAALVFEDSDYFVANTPENVFVF